MRRAGAAIGGAAVAVLALLGVSGCGSGGRTTATTTTVSAPATTTTTTVPGSIDGQIQQVGQLLDGIDAQIPGASAAEERSVTG